jgi:hypothetical protein
MERRQMTHIQSDGRGPVPPKSDTGKSPANAGLLLTGATGLEPATSGLTVRCSNQAELHPPGPESPGQSVGGDRFELPAPCL